MSALTYVNIDELKLGDTVGQCYYVSFGWGRRFRYPKIEKRVIKRITPKRTKFVLDNDVELDIREAKNLVVLDNEAQRQSSIAKIFEDLKNIDYKLNVESKRQDKYIIETKFTDEELIEYYKVMRNIYDKHLGGQN